MQNVRLLFSSSSFAFVFNCFTKCVFTSVQSMKMSSSNAKWKRDNGLNSSLIYWKLATDLFWKWANKKLNCNKCLFDFHVSVRASHRIASLYKRTSQQVHLLSAWFRTFAQVMLSVIIYNVMMPFKYACDFVAPAPQKCNSLYVWVVYRLCTAQIYLNK